MSSSPVSPFVRADGGGFQYNKSYAVRGGRITSAQQRALKELWNRYGVDFNSAPDWDSVFARRAPLALEIGGGHGEAAAHLAHAVPAHNYVVAEVYPPGIGALLNKLAAAELQNVRVIRADARTALATIFDDGALHCARIFFPDPWPKKRHHKRRLINAVFVALLATKIKPGGFVHTATDWPDYATQIRQCFAASPYFASVAVEDYPPRPPTRFAARAKEGAAADMIYTRIKN